MSERRAEIIDRIVSDLEPVRPVRLRSFFLALFAVELLILISTPVLFGWRTDIAKQLADPAFVFVLTVLLVAAALSGWSALRMSVPGREVGGTPLSVLFAVPLVAALLVVIVSPWGGSWPGFSALMDGCWACIGVSTVTAVVPWIVGVVLVARLAPLRALRVGVFAGLSAFLVGAAVLQLHCGSNDAYHLAFGHFLPVAVLALLTGAAVSGYLRLQVSSAPGDS